VTKRLTIYEVAEAAGVSIASVSRVMHGQGGVSAQTRERIEGVIERSGYVVNGAARGLAQRRVGVLGFVFCDLDEAEPPGSAVTSFYSHEVTRGAERAARQVGDAVLLAATHSASDRKRVLGLAAKVDGLAVMAGSLSTPDLRLLSDRLPVVSFAAGRPSHELDSICIQNLQGAREATRHLLGHGYTDIAFVAGPSRSAESRSRFNGYRHALADEGIEAPDRPQLRGDFTEEGGARAVAKLLSSTKKAPRALVVGNDQMAVGAIAALGRHGLRVPDDVALTGFDDIPLAQHVHPTLTTVRQPLRQIGEECSRLLLRRIDDADARIASVVLPTTLVARKSCGCAGADDG
jgi:LacI family transcriptional regulator